MSGNPVLNLMAMSLEDIFHDQVSGLLATLLGKRLPAERRLGYPQRLRSDFPRFSFLDYPQLTFEQPDLKTLHIDARPASPKGEIPDATTIRLMSGDFSIFSTMPANVTLTWPARWDSVSSAS